MKEITREQAIEIAKKYAKENGYVRLRIAESEKAFVFSWQLLGPIPFYPGDMPFAVSKRDGEISHFCSAHPEDCKFRYERLTA